jgi:hypothetical protein
VVLPPTLLAAFLTCWARTAPRFCLKGEEDPDPNKAEQYARWRELQASEGERKEGADRLRTKRLLAAANTTNCYRRTTSSY